VIVPMLFRALKDLDVGIRRGELFPGSRISQRAIPILLERGAIAEVAAPPLRDLPVWNDRQPILGVETLADVAEVDPAAYESPAQIEEWQKEAKALLNYPAPDGWYLKDPYKVTEDCGGCQEKRKKSRARKAQKVEG
jgi:hypothetical protein